MLALLIVLALGLIAGFARRGSLQNLANARLRLWPLVFVSVGLVVAAELVPRDADMLAYSLVLLSFGALFSFAGANWRISGMAFIALGAACNVTVILANQGMPISADAAARSGYAGEAAQNLVIRGKHFVSTGDDARLLFLGDVIPLGGSPAVASIGDLIIWAGMILLIQELMRGPRGRRTRLDPRDTHENAPPGHVGENPGDLTLRTIDLRNDHDPTAKSLRTEREQR